LKAFSSEQQVEDLYRNANTFMKVERRRRKQVLKLVDGLGSSFHPHEIFGRILNTLVF
jgi:hypothetical protein